MRALVMDRRSRGALVRLLGPALGVWLLVLAWATPAHAQEVIEYYGTDHLGSVRVVFDAAGTVIARSDYLPYGEEVFAPSGTMPAQKFTGQARDAEAGQDYFNARMYQPRTGRFNAIDPVYAGLRDPQEWNRYSYVSNNPLKYVDPTGMNKCMDGHVVRVEDGRVIFTLETCSEGGGGGGGWGAGFAPSNGPSYSFAPVATDPAQRAGVTSQSQDAKQEPAKNCMGAARVLGGNPRTVGRQGAFPRVTVAAGSAAVIVDQFGGWTKGQLTPHIGNISGTIYNFRRDGTVAVGVGFNGVTDQVGGEPVRQFPQLNVREGLRRLYQDLFIVELPTGPDQGISLAELTLPEGVPCPQGTTQIP